MLKKWLFILLSVCLVPQVSAENQTIKIAVASNFKTTLQVIAEQYQKDSGNKVIISSASTGILFNQISHGAPFDLFLSADSKRAELLESSNQGVAGSRFTYAQGKIAFWVNGSDQQVTKSTLLNYNERLAIANPKLAPYGLAAQQTLHTLNLWKKTRYVQGANASQTFQFIDTNNVKAGLVALALLQTKNSRDYYVIPEQYHQAIKQQGVIVAHSKDKQATQNFVVYLQSKKIKQLISSRGYL